jgi:hypothetical protein
VDGLGEVDESPAATGVEVDAAAGDTAPAGSKT